MKKLCGILAIISFFGMAGTAEACGYDIISLKQTFIQGLIFSMVFYISLKVLHILDNNSN